MISPIEPDFGECHEFLERVGHARREIVGLITLHHAPHRPYVVGSSIPIERIERLPRVGFRRRSGCPKDPRAWLRRHSPSSFRAHWD
jgi:hypothetical protein